jgi:hypothetical protein
VFSRCYAVLTRALGRSIEDDGAWRDAGWVVELAERFARRFFAAVDLYDAGEDPGRAWQYLQDEVREKRSSVLQDLVLGLIGHIVHDLPLALDDVWGSDADAPATIDDYHRVNDVLGATILPVRREIERLYNPFWSWLDWLGPSMLRLLTDEGLRLSRAAAWYNGLRVADGSDPDAVRDSLDGVTIEFVKQLFAPPGWAAHMVIRTLNTLVSLGRRWPRTTPPPLPLPTGADHQRYYFETGVGDWRGSFRFEITSWREFWRAKLAPSDRIAALLSAALMLVARKARIASRLDGFPDQGPMGVAVSNIRVSVFGWPLYALREQYALGADGQSVHVRGYERIGPFAIGGIRNKSHSGRVDAGGTTAHYTLPVYGVDWHADYTVSADRNRVESVLRCAWGRASESIARVR